MYNVKNILINLPLLTRKKSAKFINLQKEDMIEMRDILSANIFYNYI